MSIHALHIYIFRSNCSSKSFFISCVHSVAWQEHHSGLHKLYRKPFGILESEWRGVEQEGWGRGRTSGNLAPLLVRDANLTPSLVFFSFSALSAPFLFITPLPLICVFVIHPPTFSFSPLTCLHFSLLTALVFHSPSHLRSFLFSQQSLTCSLSHYVSLFLNFSLLFIWLPPFSVCLLFFLNLPPSITSLGCCQNPKTNFPWFTVGRTALPPLSVSIHKEACFRGVKTRKYVGARCACASIWAATVSTWLEQLNTQQSQWQPAAGWIHWLCWADNPLQHTYAINHSPKMFSPQLQTGMKTFGILIR